MNEPNLNGWLAPQGAYAAIKYRNLYRAGVAGLKASGNSRTASCSAISPPRPRGGRPLR